MKVKKSELIGPALDWAVAKCEGVKVRLSPTGFLTYSDRSVPTGPQGRVYEPSTAWAQGWPILEAAEISIIRDWDRVFDHDEEVEVWYGEKPGSPPDMSLVEYGPTPLIAAMRCYVASKLGEEVEVPDELLLK